MAWPTMSTGALDPLIHDPERLRIVATLAALPGGDALSVTRLQDMIRLTPGSQITRLRELGLAGYVRTERSGHREPERAQPAVALTSRTCRIASCTPPVHGLPCPGRTRSAEIPSRRASDPTAWAASAVKGAT